MLTKSTLYCAAIYIMYNIHTKQAPNKAYTQSFPVAIA